MSKIRWRNQSSIIPLFTIFLIAGCEQKNSFEWYVDHPVAMSIKHQSCKIEARHDQECINADNAFYLLEMRKFLRERVHQVESITR